MSRNGVQQGGREAAPARRTLSRDSWIRLARKTLEARGVANVKVDRLARKLNVTRGSFYFHFKWLKDLLSALQEEWRTRNCAPFQALAAQTAPPGIDLFEEIVATWVREDPFSPALDMAIRDWGRASRPVRKEVQAIDALRIGPVHCPFGARCVPLGARSNPFGARSGPFLVGGTDRKLLNQRRRPSWIPPRVP